MQRNYLSVRSAALLAFGITLLMHLFFFIMFVYGRDAVMPGGPPREPHRMDGLRLVFSMLSNYVFTFLLYIIIFRVLRSDVRHKTAAFFIVAIVSAVALSYVLMTLNIAMFGPGPHPARAIRGTIARDSVLALIVMLSSQIMYLSHRKQEFALLNETLVAENVKTRYQALKNQIDPHFLFNTLNALNSMIKLDPDRAQEYVHQLSSVFRYTLQGQEVVTLENELHFTRNYCALMQIRYGDSLSFVFDIDPKYDEYLLVPLSIQVLVENAIKHNVITKKSPLTVSVTTSGDGILTVSNAIRLKKEKEEGEGIGLANLAERYRLMWGREIAVSYTSDEFRVSLPLIKPENTETTKA